VGLAELGWPTLQASTGLYGCSTVLAVAVSSRDHCVSANNPALVGDAETGGKSSLRKTWARRLREWPAHRGKVLKRLDGIAGVMFNVWRRHRPWLGQTAIGAQSLLVCGTVRPGSASVGRRPPPAATHPQGRGSTAGIRWFLPVAGSAGQHVLQTHRRLKIRPNHRDHSKLRIGQQLVGGHRQDEFNGARRLFQRFEMCSR
jgi:hypothetical protein